MTDTLSTSLGPRSDPSTDMRPEPNRKCVGCGGYHGGVNAGRLCLERHLIAARAELAPYQKARAENIADRHLSWWEKFRRGQ